MRDNAEIRWQTVWLIELKFKLYKKILVLNLLCMVFWGPGLNLLTLRLEKPTWDRYIRNV